MNSTTKNLILLEKNAENEKKFLSIAEVKNFLRIEHSADDCLLETLINSAKEEIKKIIGKDVFYQKWKQTSMIILKEYDRDFGFSFPVGVRNITKIPLDCKPVRRILNVTAGEKTLDQDDYSAIVGPGTHYLHIRSTALIGTAKNGTIDLGITYETGLFDKVENIPYSIKVAALMIIMDMYTQGRSTLVHRNLQINGRVRSMLAQFKDYRVI